MFFLPLTPSRPLRKWLQMQSMCVWTDEEKIVNFTIHAMAITVLNDYLHFSEVCHLQTFEENLTISFYCAGDCRISFIDARCTPFACNPLCRILEHYPIVFNQSIIDGMLLTEYECYACILHEIGHLLVHTEMGVDKEIECDKFAAYRGYAHHLISALRKMDSLITVEELESRISAIENYAHGQQNR